MEHIHSSRHHVCRGRECSSVGPASGRAHAPATRRCVLSRRTPLYPLPIAPWPRPRAHIASCDVAAGESFAAIGRATHHDYRTVQNALLGTQRHHPHGGRRRDELGDRGRELLNKLIRLAPKGHTNWYAAAMSKMLGKPVKPGVIRDAWLNFQFSRHEMTVLYSEGVTQLVVIKQHTFKRYFAACKQLDPGFEDDCFYIDVCSFNTIEIASRRKGLGPMGVPLLDHAPSDRGQNWDLAAAMNRLKGVVAPYVYQGHVDADVIVAWFEKVLLPELPPGATVVLDGAGYWTGTNVVEQKLWPLSAGRQGSACCGCLRAPLGSIPSRRCLDG